MTHPVQPLRLPPRHAPAQMSPEERPDRRPDKGPDEQPDRENTAAPQGRSPAPPPHQIPAVILAGGRGSRMGGADKALLHYGAARLVDHVAARLAAQTGPLAISANGEAARFAPLDLPVLPDPLPDFPGPLAGILAGMGWAAGLGADWLISVAVDSPVFPGDLVARLAAGPGGASGLATTGGLGTVAAPCPAPEQNGQTGQNEQNLRFALAEDAGGRLHPTFGLWPVAKRHALREALERGERKMALWAEENGAIRVRFSDGKAFFNINQAEDLSRAHSLPRG